MIHLFSWFLHTFLPAPPLPTISQPVMEVGLDRAVGVSATSVCLWGLFGLWIQTDSGLSDGHESRGPCWRGPWERTVGTAFAHPLSGAQERGWIYPNCSVIFVVPVSFHHHRVKTSGPDLPTKTLKLADSALAYVTVRLSAHVQTGGNEIHSSELAAPVQDPVCVTQAPPLGLSISGRTSL